MKHALLISIVPVVVALVVVLLIQKPVPQVGALTPVSPTQHLIVRLASASFGTISTVPVTLVPAPDANQALELVSITGRRIFSSESWSGVDEGLEVKFSKATGAPVIASFSRGFENGGLQNTTSSPSWESRMGLDVKASASQALVLTASSSQSIDGDTYFLFDVLYRIIRLP